MRPWLGPPDHTVGRVIAGPGQPSTGSKHCIVAQHKHKPTTREILREAAAGGRFDHNPHLLHVAGDCGRAVQPAAAVPECGELAEGLGVARGWHQHAVIAMAAEEGRGVEAHTWTGVPSGAWPRPVKVSMITTVIGCSQRGWFRRPISPGSGGRSREATSSASSSWGISSRLSRSILKRSAVRDESAEINPFGGD